MAILYRKKDTIPGYKWSLGYTLFWLFLIVLIPLMHLFSVPFQTTLSNIGDILGNSRFLYALSITLGTAAAAAAINLILGSIVAWTLVRYPLKGKGIWDTLIDLPFALPTAVAGITLTTLLGPNSPFGHFLGTLGIHVAYTPMGIIIALVFVGFPFVIRCLQPVLLDLSKEVEEAAKSLGATPWQVFRRILFPEMWPAMLSGFTLAFARGIGEYGSVIFISGNMPFRTEVVSLLIMTKLEQHDTLGATTIALFMLTLSFVMLWGLNYIQGRVQRG
jgi:sulfate/thiosulfate transport system permease protein